MVESLSLSRSLSLADSPCWAFGNTAGRPHLKCISEAVIRSRPPDGLKLTSSAEPMSNYICKEQRYKMPLLRPGLITQSRGGRGRGLAFARNTHKYTGRGTNTDRWTEI